MRMYLNVVWAVEIKLKGQFLLSAEAHPSAGARERAEMSGRASRSVRAVNTACKSAESLPPTCSGTVPISNVPCPHKYTLFCQMESSDFRCGKHSHCILLYKLLFLGNRLSRIYQIYQNYTLEASVSPNRAP